MEAEIASRMLAVLTRWFYNQESFIKLGPIKALENTYGRSAVCVLDDEKLGIPRDGSPLDLNLSAFHSAMEDAVTQRLKTAREPTTFDARRNGHIIKLITGLVQHYGAMTLVEIEVSLFCFGILFTPDQIRNFLLCAAFLEWVVEIPLGLETYYAARAVPPALTYRFTKDSGIRDERRLRNDVREYWRLERPQRFDCITAAARLT